MEAVFEQSGESEDVLAEDGRTGQPGEEEEKQGKLH